MRVVDGRKLSVRTGVIEEWFLTSDLHRGIRDAADDFQSNESLYDDFSLAVGSERIIGLGDMFDIWENSARECAAAYPKAWNAQPRGVYGNHDPLGHNLPKHIRLGRIILAHGHEADPWNCQYKWAGRVITRLVGWLERHIHADMDRWLARLVARTPGYLPKRSRFTYAGSYLQPWRKRMLGADTSLKGIAHGHDHCAYLCTEPWGIVANPGTWAGEQSECHTIRVREESVTLFRVVA